MLQLVGLGWLGGVLCAAECDLMIFVVAAETDEGWKGGEKSLANAATTRADLIWNIFFPIHLLSSFSVQQQHRMCRVFFLILFSRLWNFEWISSNSSSNFYIKCEIIRRVYDMLNAR